MTDQLKVRFDYTTTHTRDETTDLGLLRRPGNKTSVAAVFNLAANYIVNKNVTVFARADNLFNEHYQNPVGFLRPGLGVYAGLRVNN